MAKHFESLILVFQCLSRSIRYTTKFFVSGGSNASATSSIPWLPPETGHCWMSEDILVSGSGNHGSSRALTRSILLPRQSRKRRRLPTTSGPTSGTAGGYPFPIRASILFSQTVLSNTLVPPRTKPGSPVKSGEWVELFGSKPQHSNVLSNPIISPPSYITFPKRYNGNSSAGLPLGDGCKNPHPRKLTL